MVKGDEAEGNEIIIYIDGEEIGEIMSFNMISEPVNLGALGAPVSKEVPPKVGGEAMCKCNQCGASTYAPFHEMDKTLGGRIWELMHNCDNDTWAWSSERLSGY